MIIVDTFVDFFNVKPSGCMILYIPTIFVVRKYIVRQYATKYYACFIYFSFTM